MANARKIVAAIMAATALATTAMSGISASASNLLFCKWIQRA